MPLGHADVPGSSEPSTQSQKSSFTWENGIIRLPSKQVKSLEGSYKGFSEIQKEV